MNPLKSAVAPIFLVAALGLNADARAEDMTSIQGTFVVKYVKNEMLPITDASGPVLQLFQAQGTNKNTGSHDFMDGAEVNDIGIASLVQGNGPHQGYVTLTKGADSMLTRWNGEVTTVMSAEDQPLTSYKGTWESNGGTGKYANGHGRLYGPVHQRNRVAGGLDRPVQRAGRQQLTPESIGRDIGHGWPFLYIRTRGYAMRERSTVDSYIVRIYRRGDPRRLTGMVEVIGAGEHAFNNIRQLWRLLCTYPRRKKLRAPITTPPSGD